MVLGKKSRLIDRALSLERVIEAAHDERRASDIAAFSQAAIHSQTLLSGESFRSNIGVRVEGPPTILLLLPNHGILH